MHLSTGLPREDGGHLGRAGAPSQGCVHLGRGLPGGRHLGKAIRWGCVEHSCGGILHGFCLHEHHGMEFAWGVDKGSHRLIDRGGAPRLKLITTSTENLKKSEPSKAKKNSTMRQKEDKQMQQRKNTTLTIKKQE